MQAFIDFLPVIAFVIAYWVTGEMSVAIIVIMGAVCLQLGATWVLKRELNRMLIVSAALVFLLGGISLVLDNPLFFKWKPTGLYWIFAIVFLGSQFIGRHPLARRMMTAVSKDDIELPDKIWNQLNLSWVAFFIFAGAANIYVAYAYEESVWVNFKLFGLFGITFAFLVLQALWMSRHLPETEEQNTDTEQNKD
ncbi:MAG: septation protein A [Gammaproteobacteria bacterium]